MLIDVDLGNRQVFVKGRRLHHGLVGVVAITAGIVLAVHDRKDFTRWIPDARIKLPTSQSKGRE